MFRTVCQLLRGQLKSNQDKLQFLSYPLAVKQDTPDPKKDLMRENQYGLELVQVGFKLGIFPSWREEGNQPGSTKMGRL